MRGVHSDGNFSMFEVTFLMWAFAFGFFVGMFIYGFATFNSGDPGDATFSLMLATNETLRMLYSFWLGIFTLLIYCDVYLVTHDPFIRPTLWRMHRVIKNHSVCGINIFVFLMGPYAFFSMLKVAGLYGVLLFKVTDPDQDIETMHYVSATIAFGSAVLLSFMLLYKRQRALVSQRLRHISIWQQIMTLVGNVNDPNPAAPLWKIRLFIANELYCYAELGIAIAFCIQTQQSDYADNIGYIEMILILFCVLDGFWKLNEAGDKDISITILDPKQEDEVVNVGADVVSPNTFLEEKLLSQLPEQK